MPNAITVTPRLWSDITVLYDDGQYSAIWGTFTGADGSNSRPCLGVRWNGRNGHVGYPNQGRNPLWYVEPDFMTPVVLRTLLDRLKAKLQSAQNSQYVAAIEQVLATLSP